MKTLQDFIAAIQQEKFFDPVVGDIVSIRFVRNFFDENARIVASKHAHLRAFHQADQIISVKGGAICASVYWVMLEDLRFTVDRQFFCPKSEEGEEWAWCQPEASFSIRDDFSINGGRGSERIISVVRYANETVSGHMFVKIVTELDEEPF